MTGNPPEFAKLLSRAIQAVKATDGRSVNAIQVDLGSLLHSVNPNRYINYLREGQSIPDRDKVEALARYLTSAGRLDGEWLSAFLNSSGYGRELAHLHHELFGAPPTPADVEPWAPFVFGRPVGQPPHFINRIEELDQIQRLWQRLPLQNAAVIGPPLSGKSSLLWRLQHLGRLRMVLVGLRSPALESPAAVLGSILEGLGIACTEPCTPALFARLLPAQLQQPAVVLLDDVDRALENPALDARFWNTLRAVSADASGRLGFVLTSRTPPQALLDHRGESSPFLNTIGHVIRLGPFDERTAGQLIAHSPRSFAADDVKWIVEQSRGWPALIQLLCDIRLAALEQKRLTDSWKRDAVARSEPLLRRMG